MGNTGSGLKNDIALDSEIAQVAAAGRLLEVSNAAMDEAEVSDRPFKESGGPIKALAAVTALSLAAAKNNLNLDSVMVKANFEEPARTAPDVPMLNDLLAGLELAEAAYSETETLKKRIAEQG
jgi:hypothetical protein